MSTAVLILAAGAGTRFDGPGPKLRTKIQGLPLLRRAVENAVLSGIGDIFLVTGEDTFADMGLPTITRVPNPLWSLGQATSLQAGVVAVRAAGHRSVVVGLGDQPGIPPEAWRLVAGSQASITVATYDGQRGHPIKLSAEVWSLLPTDGDEGARGLIAGRPDLVVQVACPGDPNDVDTVEDLRRWS